LECHNIAMWNGSPIDMGDFLRIEFDTNLLRWVMVNYVKGPAPVPATILERYKQGRSTAIN